MEEIPHSNDRPTPAAGGPEAGESPQVKRPDYQVPEGPAHGPEPPGPGERADSSRASSGGTGLLGAGCTAAVVALLVAAVVGLAAGFAGAHLADLVGMDGDENGRTVTIVDDETEDPVAAVAAVAVPSVVNIDITATRTVDAHGDEGLPEGHPGVPIVGSGSGVAFEYDDEGGTYVITNDHVVRQASHITVTDSEGERHDGEIVGTDPNTDIAVVRIPVELPLIELGDSDELVVGQLVVAIGSPFGLQQSVTSGVVSAIGRSLPDSSPEQGIYPLVDVIQTDAAINPGNSGGALLDRAAELVGINTAIYSDTGDSAGIGFAVPVNTAVRVAREIIETGTAEYPFLGVVGMSVTESLAEQEDLPVDEGALVIEVTEGTEAEAAGIQPDDIIVGFDGEPIRSMDDLILAVRQASIGDVVTLELWRDGEEIEVEMTVGVKPEDL